jgi:hypothetical protein
MRRERTLAITGMENLMPQGLIEKSDADGTSR